MVLVGDRGLGTLLDARHRKHFRADRGAHGQGARKDGRSGKDVVLRVPLGTVVRCDESREILAEILADEQEWTAARGGQGGRGNACFATSTDRAPQHAEPGTSGDERWLRLELKLLADVGLIGFPNAGKSTLISRISAARPRIASYPFTTLRPHLGMVDLDDRRFVVADIPGLVPGAHRGTGLGDRFLRHVERTRLLVHLLDPEPVLREEPGRGPAEDYGVIRHELEAYTPVDESDDAEDALPPLSERGELICMTKADLVPDAERRAELAEPLTRRGIAPRWISAATGEGVAGLIGAMARGLDGL